MADDPVPIGQVAEWFQMRVSALRYHADEGSLTTRRRDGRRHFAQADLRRLTLARTYVEGGMLSLDDVRALIAADPDVATRRFAEGPTGLREHTDSTCDAPVPAAPPHRPHRAGPIVLLGMRTRTSAAGRRADPTACQMKGE